MDPCKTLVGGPRFPVWLLPVEHAVDMFMVSSGGGIGLYH